MAEAEDVLVDVARHATIHARALWRRHLAPERRAPAAGFFEFAPRIDLLVTALCGRSIPLRIAQSPVPQSVLERLFRSHAGPRSRHALPATDGECIWLPAALDSGAGHAIAYYRVLALHQSTRVLRGSAQLLPADQDPLLRDSYIVLEAAAAERDLARLLPGMRRPLRELRQSAFARRPPIGAFPPALRRCEEWLRSALASECVASWLHLTGSGEASTPSDSLALARALTAQWRAAAPNVRWGSHPLLKDEWTGDLRAPLRVAEVAGAGAMSGSPKAPRSARLQRRPEVRAPREDEDDAKPGAWMVQTAQPHERAEDPAGLQRPSDRDDTTSADEYADALSELREARLVLRPGTPAEVLLSDDTPAGIARIRQPAPGAASDTLVYPEWDYRIGAYHARGCSVHIAPALPGPKAWIEQTLEAHRGTLPQIRRRFELLRARRVRVHRQTDGDEIDLDAYIEGRADMRAGHVLPQRLYQDVRRLRRDLAVMLLVDISGSTDAWIAGQRRIIDVEREALLLVCIALEGMAQPWAVHAFSGEGPQSVIVREIKRFDAPFDEHVARRIAGLEPESYTRAGAAIRHATTVLMRQPAQHRLLLLLSDGKPNDIDAYEGRYGVEDMRQSIAEARLQGVSPFCLTVDRHAAGYLPHIFGAHHYALLSHPERLPRVLLDWLRRLVSV